MTADALNDSFGLPGVLRFDNEHDGLTRAQVTLPTCTATVYLHGAHLTAWQPAGQAPGLFLSARSDFAEGKAIRGGVPVCFPWFGPRSDGGTGPSHGFARLQAWEVAFAALVPGGADEADTLHLTLTLGPTELSRSLGFDSFRVAYEFIFGEDQGRTLTLRLSVANTGTAPLRFEEALHSYFHVGDVREASLGGLEGAAYLDKRDGAKEKRAPAEPLRLTAQTDRVFPDNTGAPTIVDPVLGRTIGLSKRGSATTVVWNPWDDGAATLADMAPDAWPGFLCVETANTGADAITLAPGEAHTMEARAGITTGDRADVG